MILVLSTVSDLTPLSSPGGNAAFVLISLPSFTATITQKWIHRKVVKEATDIIPRSMQLKYPILSRSTIGVLFEKLVSAQPVQFGVELDSFIS